MNERNLGSDFDDFLREEGLLEEAQAVAAKRVTARHDLAGLAMPGLERITADPEVMGGRACIRATRVSVSLILNLTASGMTPEEIVEAYPYLETEDVSQALRYAVWLSEERGGPTGPG
jgi:uncharacterized protein (DUF433 family)